MHITNSWNFALNKFVFNFVKIWDFWNIEKVHFVSWTVFTVYYSRARHFVAVESYLGIEITASS